MTRSDLEHIRELAIARLATGREPPWVWYQLMKLREASEALIAGIDVTQPTEDSRGSLRHPGAHLRRAAEADPPDSAQHRQDMVPLRLPT